MERLKESSEVLQALDNRLQMGLVEWKLYPQNENVANTFNARCEEAVDHNGVLVLKVKKDPLKTKMQENDIQKYGYSEGENWVCEIRKSNFLSLRISSSTSSLRLGATFNGSGPATIGQFTHEDIFSLSVK
jgi:hypothetical protein